MPRRSLRSIRFLALAAPAALALAGCGGEEAISPSAIRPEPAADIDLVVDDLGITHVYAQSDADAFFGAGYAMARDRLFQMELTRREALGQSAEILGEAKLAADIGARAFDFAGLGAADYAAAAKARPEDIALVDAWAAGVNRRIDEVATGAAPRPYGLGEAELDLVPAPWTGAHALAIAKLLAFGLSNTLDAEILATALLTVAPATAEKLPLLLPAYDTYITPLAPPGGGAPVPPPLPPGARSPSGAPFPARYAPMFRATGSNNWAVDGAHSTNGRPLLAGDPHQELTSPSRLWPVHMSSARGGGTLDVIGFSFVGTPTVELGHNARLGWTATTTYADVMDLWDVPASGALTSVKLAGEARPVVARVETIRVRNGRGGVDEQTVELHDVPGLGVLLPDEILPVPRGLLADGQILLRWTGFSPTSEASAYLALDRAGSLDDFEAAIDRIDVGAQNFVAAHATDGIDYYARARVPDRGAPASHPMPWHILSGDDAASLWTRGDLPPSKQPKLRNPERGFLSSANNDPFGFVADGSVEDDPFYYGAFYDAGFRAHRIDEVLSTWTAQRHVDRADMEALQRDVHSGLADSLLPWLAEALAAAPSDPALVAYAGRSDLQGLGARLLAWDRRFDHTASAPVIFLAFEWFAARRAFAPGLTSPLFDAVAEASPQFLLGMLRNVIQHRFEGADDFAAGGRRALALAALDDAAAWLTKRFGALDAPFALEDVQAASFDTAYGGDLVVPRITMDGSVDTVNVSPAPFFQEGAPLDDFTTRGAALYRMVVGFGDDGVPEATVDFGLGTSGEPGSPHFDDQRERWAAAGHVALPFREADVEARATARARILRRR